MSLSQTHRQYLLREQIIGPAIINFALNALIGWAVFRALDEIPIWGDKGVAGDLIGTLFVLPLMVCLIVTPLVRSAARHGKAPALTSDLQSYRWLSRMPNLLIVRALLLGAVTAVLGGPVIVAVLKLSGLQTMSLTTFIWVKGGVGGLAAALVSPPIALRAIAESTPAQAPATS